MDETGKPGKLLAGKDFGKENGEWLNVQASGNVPMMTVHSA